MANENTKMSFCKPPGDEDSTIPKMMRHVTNKTLNKLGSRHDFMQEEAFENIVRQSQ